MKNPTSQFPLRAYSALELSKFYNVCKKTFLRWIKPFEEAIGERQGRYYTINQVKIILDKLGVPDDFLD